MRDTLKICVKIGFIAIFILIAFIPSEAVLRAADSAFEDVNDTHRYKEAINALHERGIIQGFPDGTFKPEKSLTRAEFSTIITKTKNIDVNQTKNRKCFLDIVPDDWFRPYVCALKAAKIVSGFPDGTFRPGNKLKRAEITQLICSAEAWAIDANVQSPYTDVTSDAYYKNCAAFAKIHGFFDGIITGTQFVPGKEVSRGEAAQFIFNSIIKGTDTVTEEDTTITEPDENDETATETNEPATIESTDIITVAPFTPHEPRSISQTFFANIQLDADFPNTFYANEVYYFDGTVTTAGYKEAFVFISHDGDSAETETISAQLDSNRRFSIPVIFRTPGNFEIGLLPGVSGSSRIAQISVLTELPSIISTASLTDKPTNLLARFEDGKTIFSWRKTEGDATKIAFTQNNKMQSYFFRQNKTSFEIPYKDFQNFTEGDVAWYVEIASATPTAVLTFNTQWLKSDIQNTKALTHSYRVIEKAKIQISSLNEVAYPTKTIVLNGKLLAAAATKASITFPDGTVHTTPLVSTPLSGEENLNANTTLNFTYQLPQTGRYIFEVNEPTGAAIVNVPIYADNGVPFIPDYFDLVNPKLDTVSPLNLPTKRNELFNLINQARQAHGLTTVTLDAGLNEISQLHSEDMVNRAFFAHVNPDGESPDDRRKKAQISTAIQENLAKSATIRYAHEGLMRSPIHRSNILDPRWRRVGLGVARDSEGYLLVTEEFSTNPLTAEDLVAITNEFISTANQMRANSPLTPLQINNTLQSVAKTWSELTVTQDFFGFTAPDGQILLQNIRNAGITKSIQAYILEGTDVEKLKPEFDNHTAITDGAFTAIGVGVAVTKDGVLRITIIYTP